MGIILLHAFFTAIALLSTVTFVAYKTKSIRLTITSGIGVFVLGFLHADYIGLFG